MVRAGDTLSRIARHYEIALAELLRMNPQIRNPDLIRRGEVIHVPEPPERPPVTPPTGVGNTDAHWFDIAMQEEATGVDEIPGLEDNPRIVEYQQSTELGDADDETPWCSSFVNWCIQQAGLQGTNSAAARSWLRWGQEIPGPRTGCIVVLSRGNSPQLGHVGFYCEDAGDRIRILGGNQSNRVNISSYPKARVLSYRWPGAAPVPLPMTDGTEAAGAAERPMGVLGDLTAEELLTACLWAEARGEPEAGQEGVCNVILNRVQKGMGQSIKDVILQPKQFSWTNPDDVNFKKVFTARTDDPTGWVRAQTICRRALAGTLVDNTRKADHYLNVELTRRLRGGTLPRWAEEGIHQGRVTVVIGHHTFLNLRG
jgi:uncharacterized protein (TIGR02594 family)